MNETLKETLHSETTPLDPHTIAIDDYMKLGSLQRALTYASSIQVLDLSPYEAEELMFLASHLDTPNIGSSQQRIYYAQTRAENLANKYSIDKNIAKIAATIEEALIRD